MSSPAPASNFLPVLSPRTVPSLLLVLDLIEGFMWKMLPSVRNESDGKGGTKRVKVSKHDRIEFLKSRLVMSAENAQVPHMAGVDWRADVPKHPTEVLIPAIKDGQYQYDGDGNVVHTTEKRWPYTVRGQSKLPNEEPITVRPLVMCDGKGLLVPYVKPHQQGAEVFYTGVDGMVSFLFRDFDPWTWKNLLDNSDNPTYRAVPAALARPESVARWNDLHIRRGDQDKTYDVASKLVKPIAHNQFGRHVLKYRPPGHPLVHNGMLGILRPGRDRAEDGKINPKTDIKRWTFGDLVGKTLALAKGLKPIPPEKGGRYEPHKLAINEMWSWIDVENVDGIWGKDTRVDQHVIRAEQDPIDAMAALGITLYSCSPFEVKGVVTRLLNAPIVDDHPIVVYLRSRGDLESDDSEDFVRRQMHAIETILLDGARGTIREARDRLVHDLREGAYHQHGLSLAGVLGAEPTPELLRTAHDRVDEDILAAAIVTSDTAKIPSFSLEIWDPNCWVLIEARKALLLEMASAAGIEMAPSPEPPPAAAPTEGEQQPATTP